MTFFTEATLIAAFAVIWSYKIRKMYIEKGKAYFEAHSGNTKYTYETWIDEWDQIFSITSLATIVFSIIAAVTMFI